MKASQLIAAGAAAVSFLIAANCLAEEPVKQSAASRQASKARDYGNRQDKESQPDAATATTATTGASPQKEVDKLPTLDTQVIDKAAKDTGDNWKKLDKVLDRF